MAGGVIERPFSLNIKCIVLSMLVAGGYWTLPPKSLAVVALLFWVSYVGLSWYDELYDCSNKMKPTLIPWGRRVFLPWKPKSYQAGMVDLSPRQIQTMDRVDHLFTFTVLFAACVYLFVYI